MPVITSSSDQKTWLRRDRARQFGIWFVWLIGVAVFMFCWQLIAEKTNWGFVLDAPRISADIWNRATPPKWGYIEKLWKPLWDTLNIATLGTLLAIIFAVPIAIMAARNTSPNTLILRPLALLIIVGSRSINSIIWAVLFVTIIGPGIFAGLMAIGLRSIGFLAKLLYEAIEEVDKSQVEAIQATGASQWQIITYGIVPQIMPTFAGISVFRWDINIRESTVLGLVGAGGIGLQLQSSLNILAWPQVSLILIMIFIAVVISEWVSAKVRGAII